MGRVVGTKEMAACLGISRRTLMRHMAAGEVVPLNPRAKFKGQGGKFKKPKGAKSYHFDVDAVMAELRVWMPQTWYS